MNNIKEYFSTNTILQIHLFSCFFMTGIIWLIQLIHYPAYRYIKPDLFQQYQSFHTQTITFLVGPMMTLELLTALALIANTPFSKTNIINIIGVVGIWIATVMLSVPAHNQLAQQLDPNIQKAFIEKLISTNWIRTALWSARSIMWLLILCWRK